MDSSLLCRCVKLRIPECYNHFLGARPMNAFIDSKRDVNNTFMSDPRNTDYK